ncbi:Unknown protein sequence [Pseudomonas amygdali pv. sesami]|nr:Unknown protein sequence [Pseudomonas amygdali pv. sesami]
MVAAFDYRADAPRRHAVLDALRPFCGATRHALVLRVSEIEARLRDKTALSFMGSERG